MRPNDPSPGGQAETPPPNAPRVSETPAESAVGAPRETVVNETVVRENGAEVPRERETVVREGAREDVPVVPITAAGAPVAVEGAREGSRTFGEYGAPQKTEPRRATPGQNRILAFTWLGVASMCVYTLAMLLAFFAPGYTLGDRIASFFLMFGVLFILMHGLGYANSMIKASYGYSEVKRRIFTPQAAPLVDCLVATFNEPPEVVEETVAAMVALDYPNKRVVILDDSTKEESREAVRAIGLRYNVLVVQRTNRRGYKAGAINDYIKGSNAEYVAVFDADALPVHNFLRDIVPIAEESPKLAFVQTPQHYANTDRSAVAMGASRQQAVFYEYICEGKAASRAAFCCGTNVVFRRAALLDVGGFDENSVTEDFSTSLNLHLKGYDSAYYNQIYVYSMAPETLPAYFTQQSRWAFGSVGAFRKVMGSMLRGGLKMRPGQWWEYFLSSTYYFVGWVNFIFMLLPIIYVFGNIKPLRQDVFTYLAIFVPYLLFTMNMFYQGMEARGYSVRDTLLGQQINFACFPVHMSAAVAGIFGMKRPFGVTPKGGEGGKATWLSLWPQLLMLVLSAAAFVWGTYKYVVGLDRNTAAIIINSLWALYHAFLLSGIFRLNKSLRARPVNERSFAANSAIRNADGTLRDDVRVVNGTPVTTAAGVGTAAAVAGGGGGVFAQTRSDGTVIPPPRMKTARPARRGGKVALVLMALSLLTLGAAGLTMFSWSQQPQIPVNVYVLDRTTGRDYQEHRALMWTLNFLKVAKQPGFNADVTGQKAEGDDTRYDYARDFSGFVPGDPADAKDDPTNQGDLVVAGETRPFPERLATPGVLMLGDTYGEFVEYDYRREKYVRYRSPERGISPDEVDRIQDFAKRGGLVIGEWNTIGYPTLPSEYQDEGAFAEGLRLTRAGLEYTQKVELPRREKDLAVSRPSAPPEKIQLLEGLVDESRESILKSKREIAKLEARIRFNETLAERVAAQKRLEETLHVDYLGFYGRYVDKFEEEREYDLRLWKNVRDQLTREFPNDKSRQEPKGPGFVFYPDGQAPIFNPETQKDEENPFARPVILTQADLREVNTTELATINVNEKFKDDPLVAGVATKTPMRYWFDVVSAKPNARVLTYYKLLIKESGLKKLRDARFPAKYLRGKGDGSQIVFPATVAYSEGKDLRSFYFAGDASDYTLISRVAEMAPSTGGIQAFLGSRTGPFPMQFYWNYYQPLMRNIFTTTPGVRYTNAKTS